MPKPDEKKLQKQLVFNYLQIQQLAEAYWVLLNAVEAKGFRQLQNHLQFTSPPEIRGVGNNEF